MNALILFPVIMRVLREIAECDIGARAVGARGLIYINFLHLLHIFTEILGKVNKLSDFLQQKNLDLAIASNLVQSLRAEFQHIRDDNLEDRYTAELFKHLRGLFYPCRPEAKKAEKVPPKFVEYSIDTIGLGHRSNCSSMLNILYSIIDCLISEMDRRFSVSSESIFRGICALDPTTESFLLEQDLIAFAELYSIDKYDLVHEIPLVKKLISKMKIR